LAKILAVRDKETGEPLRGDEVEAQVKAMLITSHDSPSNTLAWACYLLCSHAAARERLQGELAAVLGGGLPSLNALPNLPWLKGTVQETLRLYPPVWLIGRSSPSTQTQLGDYDILPNSHVLVSPYIIHRLGQHWPDSDRFDPGRFAFDMRPNGRWPAYLPFGAGPHTCIGESYAFTLVRLVLAMMWQKFSFELVQSQRIEPEFATTLTPRYGIRVRLRARADLPRAMPS
jgi:cytochrome P450